MEAGRYLIAQSEVVVKELIILLMPLQLQLQ
jgi:hypothetical protein